MSYDTGIYLFLPNRRNTARSHVKLQRVLLAVYRRQPTCISWDNVILVIFHYHIAPFLQNLGPYLFGKMEYYIRLYSIDCSYFEKFQWEADQLLPCLKNFHWRFLDLSTSSITFASFSAPSFSLILSCKHFAVVLYHNICKAVLHS